MVQYKHMPTNLKFQAFQRYFHGISHLDFTNRRNAIYKVQRIRIIFLSNSNVSLIPSSLSSTVARE